MIKKLGELVKLPEKIEFEKGSATSIRGMLQEQTFEGKNAAIDQISNIDVEIDIDKAVEIMTQEECRVFYSDSGVDVTRLELAVAIANNIKDIIREVKDDKRNNNGTRR